MTASLQSQPSHELRVRKSLVRQVGFWLALVSWYGVVVAALILLKSTEISRLSLVSACFVVPLAIPCLTGVAAWALVRGRHTEAAAGLGAAYGSNVLLALGTLLLPSVNGITSSIVMVVMALLGWPMWVLTWVGGA